MTKDRNTVRRFPDLVARAGLVIRLEGCRDQVECPNSFVVKSPARHRWTDARGSTPVQGDSRPLQPRFHDRVQLAQGRACVAAGLQPEWAIGEGPCGWFDAGWTPGSRVAREGRVRSRRGFGHIFLPAGDRRNGIDTPHGTAAPNQRGPH